ncbi:MAG: hypothetical protein LV479_11315 [Methylacidiphilales bacterium]|nr:hypothetical protein [Candidatus Methylacidiphilales bacterium]
MKWDDGREQALCLYHGYAVAVDRRATGWANRLGLVFRRTECDGYPKNMKEPVRKHLDHEIPFWVRGNPDYFVTLCALPRGINQLCHPSMGKNILQSIADYHERSRWFCHLAVLMPDHIHFLLSFPDVPSFARIIGEWKKWIVKQHGISWQENFFDHRIRNEDNDRWKADYILQNPVRAGLVQKPEAWPYIWMPEG